jgi:taurine transport system substrate-binding protein
VQVIWILDDIGNAEQLIVRDGSGINSLADLKGKKVATPFVSTSHSQLVAALQTANVNPKEVQILNMRPPEAAAAWERGDIDATFIWDPVLSKVKDGGVTKAMTDTASFLKEQGHIAEVATDYSKFVNLEFAKAAADAK